MSLEPERTWWTAAEVADAALVDLPETRQGVEAHAKRMNWRGQPGFARRREGRGGGWEYNWQLFPSRARKSLLVRTALPMPVRPPTADMDRNEAWALFERLPERAQEVARRRLEILQKLEALANAYVTKHLAAHEVARMERVSCRSIWTWLEMISGVRLDDRLNDWTASAGDELKAVVTRAFNTDKEGQINRAALYSLLRLEIADERWKRGMQAIRDAMRVVGSKSYVRFYRRAAADGLWEPVTIDLAKA